MTTTIWEKHFGDVADYLIAQVTGIDDNLDAVTALTATVTNLGNSTDTAALVATVENSADFTVRVEMGTWLENDATVGATYQLKIHITAGSFGPATWPADGVAIIEVK